MELDDVLQGRVALVTGACGGIGKAICERLARDDIKLILVDLDEMGLQTLAASLDTESMVAVVDGSNPEAVASQYRLITSEFAGVDILVNCAGILSNNKLLSTKPAEWQNVLAVNLNSAFYWCQAVVPGMQERKSALGKGALQKLSPEELRKTRVEIIMGLFEQ